MGSEASFADGLIADFPSSQTGYWRAAAVQTAHERLAAFSAWLNENDFGIFRANIACGYFVLSRLGKVDFTADALSV